MQKIEKLVVIGTSMGGFTALKNIISSIPTDISAAFILVQHLSETHPSRMANLLDKNTDLSCVMVENQMPIEMGNIYCAPGGKHVIIEHGKMLLGDGERENGARPSINHTFRSAAISYKERVIGIVLTGLLYDGSIGLESIKYHGGTTIVQDPEEAEFDQMPNSALRTHDVDFILPLEKIPATIEILMGQVKVKSKRETRIKELERLKRAFMAEDKQSKISFSTNESLAVVLQWLQERANHLEHLTEDYLLKEKPLLAQMYFTRSKEVRSHIKNLQELFPYYGMKAV